MQADHIQYNGEEEVTLIIHIGRRVPKNWARRQVTKLAGLIGFQENLWIMIKQTFRQQKKRANEESKNMHSRMHGCKFILENIDESEDLTFKLEWLKITFQGTEAQEKEEYEEVMKIYDKLSNILKKEYPKDEALSRNFKTKVLTLEQIKKAYTEGHGASEGNNISKILNEMGILTNIEMIKDYGKRE